jgi:hypothetical protein
VLLGLTVGGLTVDATGWWGEVLTRDGVSCEGRMTVGGELYGNATTGRVTSLLSTTVNRKYLFIFQIYFQYLFIRVISLLSTTVNRKFIYI